MFSSKSNKSERDCETSLKRDLYVDDDNDVFMIDDLEVDEAF